jgi:hypothetical protein
LRVEEAGDRSQVHKCLSHCVTEAPPSPWRERLSHQAPQLRHLRIRPPPPTVTPCITVDANRTKMAAVRRGCRSRRHHQLSHTERADPPLSSVQTKELRLPLLPVERASCRQRPRRTEVANPSLSHVQLQPRGPTPIGSSAPSRPRSEAESQPGRSIHRSSYRSNPGNEGASQTPDRP